MIVNYTDGPEQFERLASAWSGERLIINIADTPCVWTGRLNTLDEDACKKANLIIATGEYLGGSIVCFHGDLSLCLVTWGNTLPDFGEMCMEAVADLLTEAGAEVRRDNNDVLADGKKIASWARATTRSGWVQTVVHFSVNTDLELIKRICTKPMRKVPGQLSDYGITAEDILDRLNLGE